MIAGTKSLNENSYIIIKLHMIFTFPKAKPYSYSYSSKPCIGSIASAAHPSIILIRHPTRVLQNSPCLVCTTNQMAYIQPQIAETIGNQDMKSATQRKDYDVHLLASFCGRSLYRRVSCTCSTLSSSRSYSQPLVRISAITISSQDVILPRMHL
jgi:hypothetical protein